MEIQRSLMEKELLMESHLKDAQLKYLQAQINPHFLYNTLESIRSKALLRDEEEIATMIETLARLFRYNISQRNTESSILDELENVKNYVRIQNYRFRDKFTLKLELDDLGELPENYMMPTLTLQPIVENAIHHGLEPKISPGTILIRGFLTQSKLADLQSENQGLKLAASQAAQNSYLVSQLRPSPIPAYTVQNPYCCNQFAGCGC